MFRFKVLRFRVFKFKLLRFNVLKFKVIRFKVLGIFMQKGDKVACLL
jgi:hypothetical protein